MDAAGNAIAAWHRSEGANRVIQAGLRPAGGSFSVLGTISTNGGLPESPVIGVNSGGTATVAWRLTGLSESFIQAATRPPGGAFAKAGLALERQRQSAVPRNRDERLRRARSSPGPATTGRTRSRARPCAPPGGDFGAPELISQSSADLFHPRGLDRPRAETRPRCGPAATASTTSSRWPVTTPARPRSTTSPSPPPARSGSRSRSRRPARTCGRSARRISASATAAQADGNAVSHTYSKPGSYVVRVTATDGVGTSATTTGTTLIKARNDFTIGKLSRIRRKGTADPCCDGSRTGIGDRLRQGDQEERRSARRKAGRSS